MLEAAMITSPHLLAPLDRRALRLSSPAAETPPASRQSDSRIVSDASHARSAGAIYHDDSALIRPSQDSRGGYGPRDHAQSDRLLTPGGFRETPIVVTPRVAPGRARHAHDCALVAAGSRRWAAVAIPLARMKRA